MVSINYAFLKIGILFVVLQLSIRCTEAVPEEPYPIYQDNYLSLEEKLGICVSGTLLYIAVKPASASQVCGCCLRPDHVWYTECPVESPDVSCQSFPTWVGILSCLIGVGTFSISCLYKLKVTLPNRM